MGDPPEETAVSGNSRPGQAVSNGAFILWSVLAVLALTLAAGAVAARLAAGPRFDWLLMLAACVAAGLLAIRIPSRSRAVAPAAPTPARETSQQMLDSAGSAVVAIGLDRRLTYVNPATERLLGADAAELMSH
jgi:PAS domain-containing protein